MDILLTDLYITVKTFQFFCILSRIVDKVDNKITPAPTNDSQFGKWLKTTKSNRRPNIGNMQYTGAILSAFSSDSA